MNEIFSNLVPGEKLHQTSKGTQYRFIGRCRNEGVIYSIKKWRKTLKLETIIAAKLDFDNEIIINAQWYKKYNVKEYKNNPCNLSVLKNLLRRI
jgi:hypothetical protein